MEDWITVPGSDGNSWRLSQFGVYHLIRQHCYQKLVRQRTRRVARGGIPLRHARTQSRDRSGRTLTNMDLELPWIDVRMQGINSSRNAMSDTMLPWFENLLADNPRRGFLELVRMRHETERDARHVLNLQARTSRQNMSTIDDWVRQGERGEAAARFIRDLSASTLVVGAGFLSGGAALGLLTAGSAAKGAARYQDTENLGAATFEFLGTMIVGAIPLANSPGTATLTSSLSTVVGGAGAATAEAARSQITLVLVGAGLEGSFTGVTALLSGSKPRDALIQAGVQVGVSSISGVCGIELDSIAMPISRRIVEGTFQSVGLSLVSQALTSDFSIATGEARNGNRVPTSCDVNSPLGGTDCDAETWVRSFVMRPA